MIKMINVTEEVLDGMITEVEARIENAREKYQNNADMIEAIRNDAEKRISELSQANTNLNNSFIHLNGQLELLISMKDNDDKVSEEPTPSIDEDINDTGEPTKEAESK